jgi:hypothetical protein
MTEELGFDSQQRQDIFPCSVMSVLAVVHIQPPVQCMLDAISPVVSWQSHEADYSPPSSAKIRSVASHPHASI